MNPIDDDEYEVLPPPRQPLPEPPKPLPRLWKIEQEAAEAEARGEAPPVPGGPPIAAPGRTGRPASPQPPPPATGKRREPTGEPRPARPRAEAPRPAPARDPADRPRERRAEAERPRDRRAERGRERDEAPRKGVLIEETPEYDTYEARRRVRGIVAFVVGAAALVGLIVAVFPYLGGGEEDFGDLPDEGALVAKGGVSPAGVAKPDASDVEAKNMFENARSLAVNGKIDAASAMLEKLIASYPKTKTAGAARDALARPKRTPPLPMFLDDGPGTVVASAPVAPAPSETGPSEPGPLVAAVDSTRPAARTGFGGANLELPANPDEPIAPRPPGSAGGAPATVAVRNLPPGFHARTEAGIHASGWPNMIAADRDGAPMVLIPGGTFKMGRDDGGPEEGPTHFVTLGTYYIDQHEVTVRMFNLFAKETGARTVDSASLQAGGAVGEFSVDHPIVLVSAADAVGYCTWAGKKLPTEAQWEKAARSTDARPFPWGGSEPTWVRPRKSKQIDVVMSYDLDQSPYGVFDMAGNAWEWTADYYDSNYFKQFRAAPAVDPVGPPPRGRSAQLVIKGGSRTWQVTGREGLKPETKYPFLGFRGVLRVEDGPPAASEPATNASEPAGTGAESRPATAPRTKAAPPAGGFVPF
jgi:formylglycine-generating enzyme required for sulfatase activity